jgi:imidazolonepropionase-like amidohydrolase
MTITRGVIENGVILIKDGKILEVGDSAAIPAEARVIDAQGMTVTPGLVDAHSHLAIFGEPYMDATEDGNEMTNPNTADLRGLDSLNPADPGIAKVRAAGFTALYTGPGSANIIGGTGMAIKLRGRTAEEMFLPGTEGMKMALGENPKRVYGEKHQLPTTRMGNAAVLRNALVAAANYMEKVEKGAQDKDKKPDRDLKLEALVKVLRREMKARIHCHRADDIMTAIRVAEEFNLDFSIEHATEGYKIADILAAKHVTCIVGPLLMEPYKHELWDVRLSTPAVLVKAGVTVCLNEDTSSATRYLPMHVGLAMREGLPEEYAFKTVTINPANFLGLGARMGSLEPGKDADIAIFDGHPFSNFTRCRLTMIDGLIYHNTLVEGMIDAE